MYKITFELNSPICFIDRPVFDAIVSYLYIKDTEGFVFHTSNPCPDEKLNNFDGVPIKKHEKGYFIASQMMYDKDKSINFTHTWKKRWDNKHDDIVDFGKSKRRIEIDKGQFKSYQVPLNLYSIPEIWFYFDSDNIKYIEHLIDKYLFSLGKKRSQGYGEIKTKTIEQIDYNPFEKIIRPIPSRLHFNSHKSVNGNASIDDKDTKECMNLMEKGKIKFTGWFPPYHHPKYIEMCVIP